MPRSLTLAAVQMNAEPAPTAVRLARAEKWVAAAAQQGAQLVVLPELFNTGYGYTEDNYDRAEPLTGPTFTWMQATARAHQVHLAGTFLLRDTADIYNTLFIVAPEGRHWRYDKSYPWVWERAYFRAGHGVQVADTALGKLGMLICWDAAHTHLWAQYAGQVDAMVVSSCPPRVHDLTLAFPDGDQLRAAEAGPLLSRLAQQAEGIFKEGIPAHAAWLGVPVVNTIGAGRYDTQVPLPQVSLGNYLLWRPDKWRHFRHLAATRVTSDYGQGTLIADAAGHTLALAPADEEGYVLSTVTLADAPPPPPTTPPPPPSAPPLAYALDAVANLLLAPVYRAQARRALGSQMAPLSRETKMWVGAVLAALSLGIFLGWWLKKSGSHVFP